MCSITLITSWPAEFKSRQKLRLKEEKNSDKIDNKQDKTVHFFSRVQKIIKSCNYICAKQRKVAQLTPTGPISISSERAESTGLTSETRGRALCWLLSGESTGKVGERLGGSLRCKSSHMHEQQLVGGRPPTWREKEGC